MKNLFSLLFVAFLIICIAMPASNAFPGDIVLKPGTNRLTVISSTDRSLRIAYDFTNFSITELKTPAGIFTRISVPGYSKRGAFGEPELPADSRLIEIPAGAEVSVNIVHAVVREYNAGDVGISCPVIPNQPPVPKTGEAAEFIYHAEAYQGGSYSSPGPVSVEPLGVMRGVRVGRLDVCPFRYNPSQNTISIYEQIEFEVTFSNGDAALTDHLKRTYTDHYFQPLFRTLINYAEVRDAARDTISHYPVKYVIVSDPMFGDQLQSFIEWKTMKGFNVIEAYTNDPAVGSTTYQIKAYLQSLYDNATPEDPAPSFVLFVGDIDLVPTWTGQAASHVTDLYYVEYTNDFFPEIYYGRFSAQNAAQLQPQIDKTMMYEQYMMPDPSYLEEVVMIAGMDGTYGPIHANGQINYGTINYFNEDHNILSHTYLYPESGSNSGNIIQNVSDGVTFANYTAHGSPGGWADPSFTTGDIPTLQNDGKYGLLVGNCCSTSEYQVGECFAEALLRAENKGAMGYIGASNSTYWDEDYYFGIGVGAISGNPPAYEETTLGYYDRAFHDHGEPFADWYTTMDQMIYAGNLAVTLGSPGMAEYYWEAYCLMGDPSLMPYLGVPMAMEVAYNPLVPIGSPSFTVNAAPYSYVALSMDGTLLGTSLADSTGVAELELQGVANPGMADVVATAQNYQPFMGTVLIANPEGPFITLNQVILDDNTGNGNGQAENGETILLDTELKNWGNSDAMNVVAAMTSLDSAWITINDDFQEFGTIAAHDSVMQDGAFEIVIADSVPDQELVYLQLAIQDTTRETWNSNFFITLFAPELYTGSMNILDTVGGNSNGRLDPGETVDMFLEVGNSGHCDALNVLAVLSTSSDYITINVGSCQADTLHWGAIHSMHFNLTLSEEALLGSYIDFSFLASSSPYSCMKAFLLPVGLVVEDFESGDFTAFDWLYSGDQPWTITTSEVFEGQYAAVSGDIGDSQTSVLFLDMEVPTDDTISFYRKVSCEDDPWNDNYDWLAFYIDDVETGRWDGEVAWSRVAYPVNEGSHTFKWVFSKDYSVSSGGDAGWIDYIIFPGITEHVPVSENPAGFNGMFSIYPNPAGQSINLLFYLDRASVISVVITDLAGANISGLIQSERMDAGLHDVMVDMQELPSGVYFIILNTGQDRVVRKFIKN